MERDTVVGSCSGGAGPEDAVPTGATVVEPSPDTVGGVAAGGSPDLGRRPEVPDARSMVAELSVITVCCEVSHQPLPSVRRSIRRQGKFLTKRGSQGFSEGV